MNAFKSMLLYNCEKCCMFKNCCCTLWLSIESLHRLHLIKCVIMGPKLINVVIICFDAGRLLKMIHIIVNLGNDAFCEQNLVIRQVQRMPKKQRLFFILHILQKKYNKDENIDVTLKCKSCQKNKKRTVDNRL